MILPWGMLCAWDHTTRVLAPMWGRKALLLFYAQRDAPV